ncbi:hypothetical protein CCR75_003623 [Bremia lactucae]|uniref:Uncharacterized protein n=1 Tax=Bremia lactucae TaxID=4779 RepID=A0A976FFE0_BRELC|nr:hypothetical protein CCR75_003623 [Bremia lactucae]
MLWVGVKIAVLAAVVACYVSPQSLLQPLVGKHLGKAEVDASARVLRSFMTLMSYSLATMRSSWFWVLAAVAALQLTFWGLQLAQESIVGLSVENEKKFLLIGTVACFGTIVSIILFGDYGDAKARFRILELFFGADNYDYGLRKRLMAFYSKHNPEKLHEVDDLIKKYELNEELLFERLHRKYNALAAGATNHSVMKTIDESEFLYEEAEEERVEPDEETTACKENTTTFLRKDSGRNKRDSVAQEIQKKTRPDAIFLEIEDYGELDGTPPVSPRTAATLAYTCRQSSTLIKDAIAVAQQAQQERIEFRIANIDSKRGDGYAGH